MIESFLTQNMVTRGETSIADYLETGQSDFSDIWKESYITLYLNLTATATYSFYLEFDQFNADGFVSSGNSGNGRGYIGVDIPCFIEITYIDE